MKDDWFPLPRYRLRKDMVKRILRHEDLEGKTCLEIGYGAGDMLLLYAGLGLEVHGFDFSPLAYENASRRIKRSNKQNKITLYKEEPPVDGLKYDYLMAFEVLEHIEDDLAVLEKWASRLKPGGKLLISVPAHKRKWGHSDIAAGHFRRYEKEELIALMEKASIDIHGFWNYGFPLTLLLDPVLHYTHRNEARFLPIPPKSVQKKQAFEMESEHGKRICRASGLGRRPILDKRSFSMESGVKRKQNLFIKFFSTDFFLFPFYVIQRLFFRKDLGSGYLVLGSKN